METLSSTWYHRPAARTWRTDPPGEDALAFHREMAGYAQTPLVELPALAAELNVGRMFVKDESGRFGLPAFKVLGASYAVARALTARYGLGDRPVPLDRLAGQAAADKGLTLYAATDGNHGRAVARVAAILGVPANIFVPAAITSAAKEGIASEGAVVTELDRPYDAVVAEAADQARGPDRLLVQDTSWEGYEDIPRWIVEGYATMFREADEQLADAGVGAAWLVAVPVGVGSLAQAAVRHYRSGDRPPVLLSVEPRSAPAVLASLLAGRPVSVSTEQTIMNGLNCGSVSPIAWPYLAGGIDAAVAVTDAAAAEAVRDLGTLGVDAGPCGAASLAGVRAALGDPVRRKSLDSGDGDVAVVFSTESLKANPLPDIPDLLG
jgi:diaminopropionate ammonia-lyase